MNTHFYRILQEFNKQNLTEYLIMNESNLKTLLNHLNFKERSLLAKVFNTISWNIGSLRILKLLQNCEILSSSEYLLLQGNSEEDFEHIQGVISDMLELNNELFANIITNCAYNSSNTKLIFYLEEAIQRLIKDFQQNQNIISNNYFRNLLPYVEDDALQYFSNLHVTTLLELDINNAETALSQIDNWKVSISKDSKFYELLNEIVKTNMNSITNKILHMSLYPNFRNWKYLVIILDLIAKNADHNNSMIIKKHLRETLKTAISKGSLNLLLSILIAARTVSADEEHLIFDTYFHWYKNTIGDLKYIVSDRSEFVNTIELLTSVIEAETDTKYLEIHAKVSISPLAHCNEIVLKYKEKCRQKINKLISGKIDYTTTTNIIDSEQDLFNSQDDTSP